MRFVQRWLDRLLKAVPVVPGAARAGLLAPRAAWELQRDGAAMLLDVRSPAEFAAGHAAGALNVPVAEAATRAGEVGERARGLAVVLYCRSGVRARRAERALREGGVTNSMFHLAGQFSGWQDEGLPVETGASSS
jgi:rhodanese-related sulfurtransferase